MSPTSYQAAPPRDVGGGGRIRTFEGVRQQIYSLPQLATLVPLRAMQLCQRQKTVYHAGWTYVNACAVVDIDIFQP